MSTDKLIVITPEHALDHETDLWIQLLEVGVGKIHVRKPGMSVEHLLGLVTKVPSPYRDKITVHYYPEVTLKAKTRGLHLSYEHIIKGRVILPAHHELSASTHSWDEARKALKTCSYCFISPVYNSISKKGYHANPDLSHVPDDLKGHKIFALGGISQQNIKEVLNMGFYGAAVMGTLWEQPDTAIEKAATLIQEIYRENTYS
ncbi:thiamine phosphate synthase [Fulvivirga sp. 29W222]|uniref:Thiamine phosphate synthase n=1 Tax=Fulvivirga marina TaxID=2494733 RepID=A0A937KAW1_9BACT|nr:thiamine phosphate synthase [Fulvivirga marina]MBL6445157.1 thiamine phosphate synthase [Fulvivirga marina]